MIEPIETTFWSDFSIAEHFGHDAIEDTFKRAVNEWSFDVRYMTALVLVLNHKIWYWYQQDKEEGREKASDLTTQYNNLWIRACDKVEEMIKNKEYNSEEAKFYYRQTD